MSKPSRVKVPYGALLERAKKEGVKLEVVFNSKVPSFRSFDISRDVDLIEEILRIYGYTRIEPQRPSLPMNTEIRKPFEERIRNFLTDRGFNEVITFPWIEEELRELFKLPSYWEIVNPLNAQQRHMRTSLVPSLLKVAKFNQNNFNRDIAIFELGKVYLKEEEVPTLGLLAVGKFRKHFKVQEEWDFLTFKGVVEALLTRLGVERYSVVPKEVPHMHPYLCAEIRVEDTPLGYFGKLHPEVAQKMELKGVPYTGEIDLSRLRELSEKPLYRYISKYPPTKRDFAFVTEDLNGVAEKLLKVARKIFGNLLEETFIFDVYKGEKIGEGKVSIAVRIVLRHPERSLSDEEVNKLAEKFVNAMKREGFSLRRNGERVKT